MYLGKFTMNEAFKKNSNCLLFALNKKLSSVNMTCKTRLQHIYPSLVLVINKIVLVPQKLRSTALQYTTIAP